MTIADIYHYVKVDDRVTTSGQPTTQQLKEVAAEGFQVVINLVPPESPSLLPHENKVVQDTGLAYVHIPVSWQNPLESDFEKFMDVMQQFQGQKVFIHCAANYRASAFFSLYALRDLNWTPAQADQLIARFWKPGEYPFWDQYIENARSKIMAGRAGEPPH